MVKIGEIFSVRNVLRCSGVCVLCIGAPMLVVPSLAVKFYFGKREDTPKPDKNALNLAMQAVGLSQTASGIKSVVSPASTEALAVAAYECGMFACYHLGNRLSGKWKDANGRMIASDLTASLCFVGLVTQIIGLCCGDKPDEEEEKKEE